MMLNGKGTDGKTQMPGHNEEHSGSHPSFSLFSNLI